MDIKKYEQAIRKEIMVGKERVEAQKKEEIAFREYLNKCANMINKFLKSMGSERSYNPLTDSDYEEFVVNNFEPCTKDQKAIIAFIKTLPTYKSSIKIPSMEGMRAYKVFFELEVPFNLTRKDFSSEENYKLYKQHVFSATHNFD